MKSFNTLDSVQVAIDAHHNALVELELRRQMLAKIGDDDYEDGAVIRFERSGWAGSYTYVAIKCNDLWYVTGRVGSLGPKSWPEMVDFFTRGQKPEDIELWLVTEYENVLDAE